MAERNTFTTTTTSERITDQEVTVILRAVRLVRTEHPELDILEPPEFRDPDIMVFSDGSTVPTDAGAIILNTPQRSAGVEHAEGWIGGMEHVWQQVMNILDSRPDTPRGLRAALAAERARSMRNNRRDRL